MVVFESDDWGMVRRDSAAQIGRFGHPSDWSREEMETPADLDLLFGLLGRHRDDRGRPACFTANLVVANPDYDAIEADGFETYRDRPLAATHPEVVAKHREGAERNVWHLEYHGRSHLSAGAWLSDLQAGERRALELFHDRCHGGLSLLAAEDGRYNSEYAAFDPVTGEPIAPDAEFVRAGIDEFARIASRGPRCTIAPHYAFPDWVEGVWAAAGIRYVQGCDRRVVPGPGRAWVAAPSRAGRVSQAGCVHLARTVRFDPRPQAEARWHRGPALEAAVDRLRRGLPAVFDTHRINYVGRWRDHALDELDELLRCLTSRAAVSFLSTPEMGDLLSAGREGR